MGPSRRRLPASLLIALSAAWAWGCGGRGAPEYPAPRVEGGRVLVPLPEVSDGGVHFYSFPTGGKRVNFFVRTDGKGRLHASLDACYGCYRYGLGYRREGEAVVCNACLLSFALKEEFWDYVGPCAPIPVQHREEDGCLSLSAARLEKCARYF